jgi:hypothetical protein
MAATMKKKRLTRSSKTAILQLLNRWGRREDPNCPRQSLGHDIDWLARWWMVG